MAAVVWAPTLADVDAALASATRTDLDTGVAIRAWLDAFGSRYDVLYTAAAAAAKASSATLTAAALAAWTTDASAKHTQADEAARYVLDLYGTPPSPLTFDAAHPDAVTGRLYDAIRVAKANGNSDVQASLAAHQRAMVAARNAKPSAPVEVSPYDDPCNLAPAPFAEGLAPGIERRPSTLRELEAALSAQVAFAATWVAQVAYT